MGSRNRVAFEPTKETIAIIHPRDGEGDPFKILGCYFDVQLKMDLAINKVVTHVKPKVQALLRTRYIYDTENLIQQFKTHIWGHLEYVSGSILHATETVLGRLDRIQNSFLRDIDVTPEEAFLKYNFAPTVLRRDIGLLGFVHKATLEKCHPGIQKLLTLREPNAYDYHNKPIKNYLDNVICHHGIFFRSIFGTALLYNRLSQSIVNEPTITKFQARLTTITRLRCTAEDPE